MIHNKFRLFYELLGGAVLLVISVAIGAGFFDRDNRNDYHMNLATEGLGILATVFIINRWYAHREKQSLRRRLVREAGSRSNDIAISAVNWLRVEGWLDGDAGVLAGAFLLRANLKEADLSHANLQGAYMSRVEMQGAVLIETDLKGAMLDKSDLRELASMKSDLRGAFIGGSQIQNAQLWEADLRGANLAGAYLYGAQFGGANLKGATLPDGTVAATEDYDMDRFTDWDHPEFDSTHKKVESIRIQFTLG